MYNTIDVHVCR